MVNTLSIISYNFRPSEFVRLLCWIVLPYWFFYPRNRLRLSNFEKRQPGRPPIENTVQEKQFSYCFRVFDTFCGLIDIRCGNALIHGAFDLFCSCLFKFMSCTFKPQKCQTQPKLSNRIKRILNPFILPSSLLKPFSICQIKEKIFITICIKWVLD